jgi:predicted Holliday junction resolvase-like endonuclease
MIEFLVVTIFLLTGVVALISYRFHKFTRQMLVGLAKEQKGQTDVKADINSLMRLIGQSSNIDWSPLEERLKTYINKVPEQVTNSITGTANTHKGKIGELIGYIQLKAEYDRIIPLGGITDFVGIKYDTDKETGHVHFIDIKTGKHSKLTTDQRKFKKILDKKAISFRTIRIDDVETQ